MQDGKSAAREKELLAAADVAGIIGVKETTVYRWCKEGKLPCLKIGKHWRIRRRVLEDFLKQSERPRTLVGQLDSFLRVPDNVLAIAHNIEILHRLDAGRLEREGRLLMRAEEEPLGGRRGEQLGRLIEEGGEGHTVWASFNWVRPIELETALEQQKR